jgi:TATA-box binding protein (TBP) (component of TFIID and TFIIIB)
MDINGNTNKTLEYKAINQVKISKKDEVQLEKHIQKSLETLTILPKQTFIKDYPKFEESNLSTRTFIINTNLVLVKKFIFILPTIEYIITPKKRGRRKKVDLPDPNINIPEGSIITIIPDDGSVIGIDLKNINRPNKKRKIFRNSTTIVMIIENKRINFKISLNGKFQMTGCKSLQQAEKCVKYFWGYIKDTDTYSLSGEFFEAYFRPVMCNISFYLGFMINRENLDYYFTMNYPQYPSFWETSIGSAGTNIKFPVTNLDKINIKKLRYSDNKWMKSFVSYEQYKNLFCVEKKKKDDGKHTTFLVFHKGKVNMSSVDLEMMDDPFYSFVNIINECRHEIEEKIIV